jgi:hypothetical protein
MKKIIYSLCTLLYLLFLFPSSPAGIMPAIAEVEIINHMMTRNPQWDTGCSTPIPADTFDYTDTEANCWFSWNNAPATDEIACQWYKPDGELYTEQKNLTSYALGCWYSRILINGYAPEKIPGEWQVKVYFSGVLKFTEHFTLHGDPSADQCAAELLYGEHSEETELLRYLRDAFLRQSPEGREITALYYRYSPVIVNLLREDEELQQEVKIIADAVLGLMESPGQKEEKH